MISKIVKNTIKRYKLIEKFDKLVIGVSGGPDSIALFYILYSLRKEFKLNLHIAHLDHMLRKDSHKDKEFVERLAKRLAIPITTAKINVKKMNQSGSLEEIARNTRLDFLFRVAQDVKANKIALGHNLDDQAETVLMRILRGTGLYGLSGILPKRDIMGYCIIRPLIELKRKDILAFLKRKKINPCLDTSNLEDIYFRNKIRNRLLPLLEKKYNKNIKVILSNMAQSIGYDYDYLSQAAKRVIKRTGRKINLEKFKKIHPAIQRLVLRLVISKIQGNTRRITFQHMRELEDLILNRSINSVVNLPKGISVLKKKKYLIFYRTDK